VIRKRPLTNNDPHYPDHTFLPSQNVGIMKWGKFIAMGDPDEVVTDRNLEEIYGVGMRIVY